MHRLQRLRSFTRRSFHSTARSDNYAKFSELVRTELPKNPALQDVTQAVWKNETVTAVCPALVIRLASLRGEVTKKVWEDLGNDPNDVQILAVGSTAIPKHLTRFHNFLKNWVNQSSELSAEFRKGIDWSIGYDLVSKGSSRGTIPVLKLFAKHYGFTDKHIDQLADNIAITSGGMRGLKDLVDGSLMRSKAAKTFHRFIQPDNSFGTWWNIIEKPVQDDANRREIHTIQTSPLNKLHLTPEDVNEFYANHPAHTHESWYITPVGNPSGTAMTPEQLITTCEAIIMHNPNAYILLDTVYVRTLSADDARELMAPVLENESVLNHTIFLESFSKSHALCRERLGCYFSFNPKLFTTLHAANIAYSAGPGHTKDFQFEALGCASAADNEGIRDLHQFWQAERKGLYSHLIKNFSHLFEETQPHITEQDINRTLGLYLLLKTADRVQAKHIFLESGILGVDTPLLSGHYVRFSVGQMLQPKYSALE